ncbi:MULTISPECIES: HAMP domain-containing sensor histidine kinase [Acidobacterium]|uniref:histidine kinase n=1 Tax=Acidobacterium capsulatum (strain ATCC 51196 / DSM 11244 / BCRC 80197 / JCM 7670 / NBRC 15755 / NCIMB 13165 / 161) TaxID=240015 RepID=C1F2N0_ACIC5|nr:MULTISPECIES: HAMP domain-containing sensor histidine kinase [Acidobacterium]ACO34674.1 sensor histidine kinase [Acidobacterium capsulatum ATCC 51196]HCT61452.1 sensor histidine kinase [Acidobacterium sp.]
MRKSYSLRRRLIVTVLLLEVALALGISGATLIYTRHDQFRAFDLMLRGRADSLLGAVQDAEDASDTVKVDLHALDLRRGDLWQVVEQNGRVLAQSARWTPDCREAILHGQYRNFRLHNGHYRGIVLHGVRQIDADDGGPGIARPVTIYYAASVHHVYEEVQRAGQFLLLANGILLLITGTILVFLLRRGLAPLDHLNRAAAQVQPSQPLFRTPEDVALVEELGALAATLESATLRLDEGFRQQQIFLHNAAHELKTAVTIVKSSLQLLASRPRSSEDYHAGLNLCLADCGRMEELVQSMLLLARLEQPALRAQTVCNITEAALAAAAQFERMAQSGQIELHAETDDPAWVPVDAEAAATLLSNLVVNALQHTPPARNVWIRVQTQPGNVRLQIEDQGEGIPPEDLPHVFERFYRGDRSRSRATGGTGLGLAICKAIVESCGGSIAIRSQPGKGTCVDVLLPASQHHRA